VTAESNRKPTYLDIFGSKKTKGIKQDSQNLYLRDENTK
jgi:hypothetical protein